MDRPALPLLGFLSLLWIGLGTWWLSSSFCGAAAGSSSSSQFMLRDGEFTSSSNSTFTFDRSTNDINFSKSMQNALRNTAVHLAENPNKRLVLNGLYSNSEENGTTYDDLGLARADALRKILISYKANADQIETRSSLADNLSFVDDRLMGGVLFHFDEAGGEITDEGTDSGMGGAGSTATAVSAVDQKYTFEYSDKNFRFGVTPDMEPVMKAWQEYIAANPASKVIVRAYTNDDISEGEALSLTDYVAKNNRRVLRNYGFKSPEVESQDKGYSDLLTTDNSPKNQRVEIFLSK